MKNKTIYPTEKEILVYPAVDWERRRYEIAKEVLPEFIQIENEWAGGIGIGDDDLHHAAGFAVAAADALIKRLKDETKP